MPSTRLPLGRVDYCKIMAILVVQEVTQHLLPITQQLAPTTFNLQRLAAAAAAVHIVIQGIVAGLVVKKGVQAAVHLSITGLKAEQALLVKVIMADKQPWFIAILGVRMVATLIGKRVVVAVQVHHQLEPTSPIIRGEAQMARLQTRQVRAA